MWLQKELTLKAKARGFHLITDELLRQLPELKHLSIGLCHIFIKHSSASLTINENADPTVRQDFEQFFSKVFNFFSISFCVSASASAAALSHILI